MISRRQILAGGVSLCIYAMLREARAILPSRVPLSARQWINCQTDLAQSLASGKITQGQWHDAVNKLATEVDVEDMGRMIRRASVGSTREPLLNEPRRRFIIVNTDEGTLRLPYSVALFDFGVDGVIAPHAHKNMASAHMVMDGKIRIRTYDRIADHDDSLVIRPSGDIEAEAGHAAAMTPEKDNVHWFSSSSRRAMTIDVVIANLDKKQPKSYEIQPIDAMAATELAGGDLRVPRISFEESRARYGARL